MLLEADGITDEYGSHAVWPVAEIERQNKQFRTNEGFRDLYMPFDHLLLFGADAGSDHFAFAIHADGKIHKNDVYRWEHENDARSWLCGASNSFWKNGSRARTTEGGITSRCSGPGGRRGPRDSRSGRCPPGR